MHQQTGVDAHWIWGKFSVKNIVKHGHTTDIRVPYGAIQISLRQAEQPITRSEGWCCKLIVRIFIGIAFTWFKPKARPFCTICTLLNIKAFIVYFRFCLPSE